MRAAIPGSQLSLRARLAVLLSLLAMAALGVGLTGSRAGASGDYRLDVIFDSAKGIIPGNVVKVAGARVGTVKNVSLTPDYKARIETTVESRLAPFHKDARCNLESEALIGERFVNCQPGNPDSPPLTGSDGHPATVPVANTSVPVSFTDLFNIFRLPVRQRFGVFAASLGLGLAGRGEDLNDILRRANPTLDLVRRTVRVLNRQRTQLAATVTAADEIATQLARHDTGIRRFIDRGAATVRQTAKHHSALSESMRRLPGLLAAAQPALRRLDAFTKNGAPVLADLHRAAPQLNRLVGDLEPFSRVGTPALKDMGSVLAASKPLVKRVTPQFRQLGVFAEQALPTGKLLGQFFTNLRDRGFSEGLLRFVYGVGMASARYDAISHILPISLIVNGCMVYAQVAQPGCSANYGATPATRSARGRTTPTRNVRRPAHKIDSAPPATAPTGPGAPDTSTRPAIRVPGLPPINLPRVPKLGVGAHGNTPQGDRSNAINGLLDYLLG
jgi:virulence factor Mce-like protein